MSSRGSNVVFARAVLILLFFGMLAWIHPQPGGADPLAYAGQAFAFLQQHNLAETRAVLEFGHLIWRPIAVAVTPLCAPIVIGLTGLEPMLVPLVVLITVNVIFTLIAILLVYRITRSLSGSVIAGAFIAMLFLTTNAVLTYARSGFPYLAGAAMQLLAVSLVVSPPARWSRLLGLRSLIVGGALATSICLWTPYVISVPGIIILAFLWQDGGLTRPERARLAAQASLWMMLVTGVAFGGAILLNHFRSFGQIAQWIRVSSHEWAQTHRLWRLATGLPRSFLAFPREESIILKRFYFHDPYAPVTWTQIASVAWIPPFVALGMAALGCILARTAGGRRLLIASLCSWIPLLVFSVAVFEPGSPERFLPGYALLFTSLGYVPNSLRLSWRDPASCVLAAFFAVMVPVNVSSVTPRAAVIRSQNAVQRLNAMCKVWRPGTLLVLLSYSDGIFRLQSDEPFSTLNRIPFNFLDAIEPATLRRLRFRQEFAAGAFHAWQHGGEVWISKRLVAERPRPEWDWVEGDSPGVGWRALSNYYRQFETDANTGGDDGFLRIPANEMNYGLAKRSYGCGGAPASTPVRTLPN